MAEKTLQEQKIDACKRSGHFVEHVGCWRCGGDGVDGHDCGDDTCCCLHPEDNMVCDICEGAGGYEICFTCHPEDACDYE